jgi:uncharacterized protein YkwD
VRGGLIAAAVTVVLAAGAPSADAAEQCLYQGLEVDRGHRATVERSLLCLTNLHRFRGGVPPVLLDTRLTVAARGHSSDMVARGYFDHYNPEGAGPSDRAVAAGYLAGAAENIAANGTGTAWSLFEQWRDSPGHNANMLGSYVAAGMGVAPGFPGISRAGSVTGTQNFGFSAPDSGDTALDLYASSDKCAQAMLARISAKRKLAKAGKRRKPLWRRKLRRVKRQVRANCAPLA